MTDDQTGADPEGEQPEDDQIVELTEVADALAAYFTPEELHELAIGAAALAAGTPRDTGATVWPELVNAVVLTGHAGDLAGDGNAAVMPVVNDQGIDPAREPIVLYPNSQRAGQPVEVVLVRTGERTLVVPPGEAWTTVGGQGSSLAQQLWVSRPGSVWQ